MSPEPEPLEFDPAQTVVFNGLIDLFAEDTIVLDADSAERLHRVVETVMTPEERDATRAELIRLADVEAGESVDLDPEVHRFVEAVTAELADEGYSVSVRHEYQQDIPPLDAHLYTFLNTGDVEQLQSLDLDPSVEEALFEGADALETGSVDRAREEFSTAVDRATDRTEVVVSRVLAGWGYFLAGGDDPALDHVRAALDQEDSSWVARIVGAAVRRDEDDFIRSGEKSIGIVLRWDVDEPEDTSTRVAIGGRTEGNEVTWEEVSHVGGHAFVDRIYPDMRLRFTLRGDLPAFPGLRMYFLGFGIYDAEMDYIESVIDRFGTGPHNQGSVERVTIER